MTKDTADPTEAFDPTRAFREAERLREDVARLCAALEPFAEAARLYVEGDEHLIVSGTKLTIGNLRTAATVLADVRSRDGGGNG